MLFPISDLPPQMPVQDVRVYCSVEAAIHYDMPADLIYGVSLTEGGSSDSKVRNSNGTFDLGYMQFNTAYLKTLSNEGVNADDVVKKNCYPFHLAAWRIKNHLLEPGTDLLQKVAFYHSRTPKFNNIYKKKLQQNIRNMPLKKAEKFFNLIIKRLKSLYSLQSKVDK